jgi:hypothetical protein
MMDIDEPATVPYKQSEAREHISTNGQRASERGGYGRGTVSKRGAHVAFGQGSVGSRGGGRGGCRGGGRGGFGGGRGGGYSSSPTAIKIDGPNDQPFWRNSRISNGQARWMLEADLCFNCYKNRPECSRRRANPNKCPETSFRPRRSPRRSTRKLMDRQNV